MADNFAFLGLGSNEGDRLQNIERAYELLQKNCVVLVKRSAVYETAPYGFLEQPAFLNIVCKVKTAENPFGLLKCCQMVEYELGRIRAIKFGPRNIDIDILLFNDEKINTDELTIPHYDMHNRQFFLIPLLEIAGDIVLSGRKLSELISSLGDQNVKVFDKNE